MAEYKRGEMDIRDHEKTFEGFLKFSMYVAATVIVILILLAVYNS